MSPLRIGILGAANIARQFTAGVAPSKLLHVMAVASRTDAKAEAFARECNIPRWFGSYEAMLADPAIDAIYNPLPNGLHAEWSIKAAEAGKHVLCEKPLAGSVDDAAAMFTAARRNKVHLVEAYPYLAQPQTRKAMELLRAGAIGRPRLIRASFGFNLADLTNIRYAADLAGGAVMDAGSYPVSFVRVAAGACPVRATAVAEWASTGVDRTLVGTFEFADGLFAQVAASMGVGMHRSAEIAGDGGVLDTTYLNHPPLVGPPSVNIRRGPTAATPRETIETEGGNGFFYEAESFARLVGSGDAGQWTGITPQESIDVAAMLDALRAAARTGGAVPVRRLMA
jgi:D-xylose 1-dehydrogenase (NADP+, D-xylono-1,5-lactone-forming)